MGRWGSVALLVWFTLLAPAAAQQNPLVGQWRTQLPGPMGIPAVVTLTLQPNGQYSQFMQSNGGPAEIVGYYEVVGQGAVQFEVSDWEPKRQCMAQGGCVRIEEPPGGSYDFWFPSAGVLALRQYGVPQPVYFQRLR